MEAAIARVIQAQPVEIRTQKTGSILWNCFKMNPPIFSGETDPLVAEDWLKQVNNVLDGMKVEDDATKILLVIYQQKGPVELW